MGLISFPPSTIRFDRYQKYVDALEMLVLNICPAAAIVEGYGYANAHTLVTLVEIGTLLRQVLYRLKIPVIEVAPTSLKKFATGSGNAKKDQMLLAIYKRWGIECKNDNEGDAFALAMFGSYLYNVPNVELPKVHMEPVLRMKENIVVTT